MCTLNYTQKEREGGRGTEREREREGGREGGREGERELSPMTLATKAMGNCEAKRVRNHGAA